MEKILTVEQKLQRAALGLPIDGYRIVVALPPEEPRRPEPVPALDQARQRRQFGLPLREQDSAALRAARESEERSAKQTWQLSQITHRLAAGLIDKTQYLSERRQLTEKLERGADSKQPLFESVSPEAQRQEWRAAYRAARTPADRDQWLTRIAESTVSEQDSRTATLRGERQQLVEVGRTKFQVLSESKDAGLRVKGVLSIADKRNGNGRVYPRALWAKQIEKLQPLLAQKRVVGATDHPSDGVSRISEAAILWDKIYLDHDGVTTIGEGSVLNTSKGRDLQALIRGGALVDISSRGFGTVEKRTYNGQDAEVVGDDFDLVTFDAVLAGSVENANIHAA